MNLTEAIPLPEPAVTCPSTFWCDAPIDLAAVFDAGVNVAVLRRPATFSLAAGAAPLDHERDLRVAVRPRGGDLSLVLAAFHQEVADAVTSDLRALIGLFADVTECDAVGVRMAVSRSPMCPRFHVDHVTLRGVVTYVGAGSEWVDHGAVDRRRMGHAADGVADDRSGLLRPGAVIERARPFDLVLFKGTAWPGNAARGAVHRSPCGDGGPRLMFTFDALG